MIKAAGQWCEVTLERVREALLSPLDNPQGFVVYTVHG